MLTNILIALPDEAGQILSASGAGAWPRLEFNDLDNDALSGLWAALGANTDETSALQGDKHLLVHTKEAWVFAFPSDFVRRLSALQQGDQSTVAEAWARHEELVRMGASGADVQPVIDALCGFARRADAEHKGLLLFMAL